MPAALLQACDSGDVDIIDEVLIKFLSESKEWLDSLREVNLKRCHYVTRNLLTFLRAHSPKLKKLSPSRWADHGSLREIATFACLEVGEARATVC